MSETEAADPDATRAWARERRAAFEIQPLVEMHDGRRVAVGFELHLYAQLAMDGDAAARVADARDTHERLAAPPRSTLTAEHPAARVEISPSRAAAKLRPQAGYRPEMAVEGRILRREETFEPLDAGSRERLAPLEERLLALGLRRSGWGA